MFKKIFTMVCALFVGLGGIIGLTSCHESDSGIEVKSFSSDKQTYIKDEDIHFSIGIKADENYTILTAEIKPDSSDAFTIDLNSEDNYVYSGIQKYDGVSTKYSLRTIGYTRIVNESDVEADSLEVRGFSVSTRIDSNNNSGVELTKMTVTNPEENEDYYIGQKINVSLEFKNPNNMKINNFYFEYSTAEKDFPITVSNVDFKNLTNYSFEVDLPSIESYGEGELKLTGVDFINPTSLKIENTKLAITDTTPTCKLNLKLREFSLSKIDFVLSGLKYSTIDGIYTFEKGTSIPINIEIYDPNRIKFKIVTINGTNYKPVSSTYNTVSKTTLIKVNVSPSSKTDTLDLIDIKIEKISYTSSDNSVTLNYSPSSSISNKKIYAVNKLISSKEDLTQLFNSSEITGYNLVTSKIDMLNSGFHTSSLKGTIDFAGNIISNYKATLPMFDTIQETGVIKNLSLKNATVSTSNDSLNSCACLFAYTNNGLINNIKINNLNFNANSIHNYLDEDGSHYTEIALVKTNETNGIITNLDITASLYSTGTDSLFYDYSFLFIENKGTIAYVYSYFTSLSTIGNGKTGFYLTGRKNSGSLIGLTFDFGIEEKELSTTKLYFQPCEGVNSDSLIINEKVLTCFKKYYDIPEWQDKTNPYSEMLKNDSSNLNNYVSVKILNGGDSAAQYELFNSLGFEQSGNGFVWVYGIGSGRPYLIYKK